MDETVLGDRARLNISHNPAQLHLKPVFAEDAGFYKCRVDFSRHPTKTTRVHLHVIGNYSNLFFINNYF